MIHITITHIILSRLNLPEIVSGGHINKKEAANMKIKLNPDQEIVNMKRNMAFR